MLIEYTIKIDGGSTITQSVNLGGAGATTKPIQHAGAHSDRPASEEPIKDAQLGEHHQSSHQRPVTPGRPGEGKADTLGSGDPPPTKSGGGDPPPTKSGGGD